MKNNVFSQKGIFFSSLKVNTNELNLSGLLNALDGLLELSGSIVVLTTNYPENLDRALIRPGRITKKLYMGYMSEGSIQEMISYYFGGSLCPSTFGKTLKITPAKVENLCLESNNVQDIETKLRNFANIVANKSE